jgi:hypothetical protein
VKTELSVLIKKRFPVTSFGPGEIAPEVRVTDVPEIVAVNEPIDGPMDVLCTVVVPPPVIATSPPHETVGIGVPCVKIFFLFGLFPSRGLSPAKKVAR